MNQTAPSPTTPPAGSGPEAQPPTNRRATMLVVGVAIAIVAIPLLTVSLPIEIAYWHVAHANVQQREGDCEAVVASLEKAVQYAPHDAQLHRLRSQTLLECKLLKESLAAVDRALELAPTDLGTHLQRAQTLMEMQRFSEAVEAIETVVDPDGSGTLQSTSPMLLNMLAYARALANEHLDQALEEVNLALSMQGSADPTSRAAMLDTRGFILYQQGQYVEALADFEQAVAATDPRRMEHLAESAKQVRPADEIAEQLARSREESAVILYHRGLIHEALGNQEQAEADFAQVRALGFEPNESLY